MNTHRPPGSLNLRQEVDSLIEQFGQPFLLIVQSRSMRCSKWENEEHDPHCLLCAGTGWMTRRLKRRGVVQNASDVVSHAHLTKPTSMGDLWSAAYVFYFEPNIPLKPGDLILEVGWKQRIPWGLKRVYEIQHVDQLRDKDEAPAYIYAGAMQKTLDEPFYQKMVNQITRDIQRGR